MYICIDFDGTIVDHRFPDIGPPVPKALEWLKKFQEAGAKLILFTMRSNGGRSGDALARALQYLEDNGIALYGVNHNPSQVHWTSSPKAYGQIYIDDAAFGCPLIHPEGFQRPCVDWDIVGPGVMEKLLDK
ncbi:MAG: hypothetical protein WBB69_00740 [Anaerolineales bacterium]